MKTSLNLIVYLISGNVFLFSVEGGRGAAKDKCHDTPMNRTGHLGGSVTIDCSYPRAEGNLVKHFYKDAQNGRFVIIESESPKTQRDRFTLTDAKERGIYTVCISELKHGDAGKYVCALKNETQTTCLNEIRLRVLTWDDIKPRNLSYGTSETIYINCSYAHKYKENVKFLCKGENPTNCVHLISTTNDARVEVKFRFHIKDSPRHNYFYVNIREAKKSDSGTYWCGFGETLQRDGYTKILLSVAEKKEADRPGREEQEAAAAAAADDDDDDDEDDDNDDDDMKPPSTYKLIWLFGILGCSLVMVAVVSLMLCRQRLTCTRGRESPGGNTSPGRNWQGENEDHNYEEIPFERQPVSSLPSVDAPADQLLYSLVSFDAKDTDREDRPPEPASTIYSTARNPEEQ